MSPQTEAPRSESIAFSLEALFSFRALARTLQFAGGAAGNCGAAHAAFANVDTLIELSAVVALVSLSDTHLLLFSALRCLRVRAGDSPNYWRIGVRNWEFIVNPIVDIGLGKYGEADFAPAVRLARKLEKSLFVGLEYYADFGEIGSLSKLPEQQHTLFAITEFKLGVFDVNLRASDRFVVKTIVGYAFPAPGGNPDVSERALTGPVNPMPRSAARTASY